MSSDFVSSSSFEDVISSITNGGLLGTSISTGSRSVKAGSLVSCVPLGGGLLMKPSMATSTNARWESQALIMYLDFWKQLGMGVEPKMT